MKKVCFALVFGAALMAASSQNAGIDASRAWDLTIRTPSQTYPSWLEISDVMGGPKVQVVGRVASVHPADDVKVDGHHISFATAEFFGKKIPVTWDIMVENDKLTGTQKRSDGVVGSISGVPAPTLNRPAPASWSNPETLFDGKDLSGWIPDKPSANHWAAINGELVNKSAGANIRTNRKFQDFRLHVEYNCPQGGNSGVYLRGRYEVQVEYEPSGTEDPLHSMGSIYGFIAPAAVVSPKPGQWESLDITLIGRHVTIVRDDIKIIDDAEIPGITGGALDSDEAEPGPIYLQGDHTGGMKYRDIKISLAQR